MLRGRGRSIVTSSSTRPGAALITTTRSASRIASSMWCVTKRMVDLKPRPDLEQELLHQHARLEVERGERLVHQDELGLPTSARAIATRCFMPPESWCG